MNDWGKKKVEKRRKEKFAKLQTTVLTAFADTTRRPVRPVRVDGMLETTPPSAYALASSSAACD